MFFSESQNLIHNHAVKGILQPWLVRVVYGSPHDGNSELFQKGIVRYSVTY